MFYLSPRRTTRRWQQGAASGAFNIPRRVTRWGNSFTMPPKSTKALHVEGPEHVAEDDATVDDDAAIVADERNKADVPDDMP